MKKRTLFAALLALPLVLGVACTKINWPFCPPPSTTLTPTPTPAPVHSAACTLSGWTLNGNALWSSPTQIQLTAAVANQDSSAFAPTQLDLTKNFDLEFIVYLGNLPAGNGGIAFVLQSEGLNALGGLGGGDGFGELNGFPPLNPSIAIHPSVDVEIDDFPNIEFPEPAYDHIGVLENGIETTYVNLGGAAVPALSGNATVRDGAEHQFRITWDAMAKSMKVYFDGNNVTEYDKDMVATVFGGVSNVYFGMTGATGGGYELTYFRSLNCN